MALDSRIKIGGGEGQVAIDGLSGATVTVMVMNVAITRGATELARHLGIIQQDQQSLKSAIAQDVFQSLNWSDLLTAQLMSTLTIREGDVEAAFKGTEAEGQSTKPSEQLFAEVAFGLADVPTLGKNLLGEQEFQWLQSQLQPGEHVLVLLGNGYSFKGSGYVRGGIFDRIQLLQNDLAISFRDLDQIRVTDIWIAGAPAFKEMSLFIIREHHWSALAI